MAKIPKWIWCLLLLVPCGNLMSQGTDKYWGIIPAPQSVKSVAGQFSLSPGEKFVITWQTEEDRKTAQLFAGFLEENYHLTSVVTGKAKKRQKAIAFRSLGYDNPNAESYSIDVSTDGIVVAGKGAGLFYGLQTLTQMISYSGTQEVRIPCVAIRDQPRFRYRGIMQDVGYHIYPVEFIKRQIDWLAKYKLNVYHWHLTEDHGWRIEIKKYPNLTKIGAYRDQTVVSNYNEQMNGLDGTPYGGFYTQDEVRELVRYAAERHVTVIPEIELPGHSLAALASYPELACGDNPGPFKAAQYWGIYDDVYCAGKEQTFQFLEDVLTEVMELFPSPYIHIGGDECPKGRWEKCKYCQQRIKDNHLEDEYALQSYFVKRIEKFVNSKGRRIIGWDEIREGGLAPDATVMAWRSVDEGIKAAEESHDVVMAPVDYLYFDYVQGNRKQEPLAIAWGVSPENPGWGVVSLETVYNFEPVPPQLTTEQQKHIIGVEAPLWTEHIDTYRKVDYMFFPRLMALAEIGWTDSGRKDWKNFNEERLPAHLAWMDATETLYRVPPPIGVNDTTLKGKEFTIEWKIPVKGARIFYNFEGQEPRETDYVYEQPVRVIVPEGQKRELKAIVITPSGKRSNSTTIYFEN